MKEKVKDELRKLIETCDDEELLLEAKEILQSQESFQISNQNTGKENSAFDKIFGLWKEKDVDLNKLREKQWERKIN